MNLEVKIYENTSDIGRLNDPKWQFNVEWSDKKFDIYENNVELSHLYVDMSKFMAHGTVTFTCFNHMIRVVLTSDRW